MVCGCLLVVCDHLNSFVVVCGHNYAFGSGIPITYSSVTTKFLLLIASLSAITAFTAITPVRYYCLLTTQYLLIILLAGTPFSYFCQLLLLLIITSYKPAISATIFKYYYQVTLAHTLISFLHQLFSSATFISYSYSTCISQ